MDKQNSIKIKMNGREPTLIDNKEKAVEKEIWEDSIEEQAATIENRFNPEDLIEYEKNHDPSEDEEWLQPVKKKKKGNIKPILKVFSIAGGSAIIIGVTLGVIMLQMFAGIDNGSDSSTALATASPDTETNNTTDANTNAVTISTEKLNAYVIQGGVFSTKERAEEAKQQFATAGFSSIIWGTEGQYRPLIGVSKSEQGLTLTADAMKESGFKPYAGKAWTSNAVEVKLDSSSADWIKQFPSLWNAAVTSGDTADVSAWEEWIAKQPKETTGQVSKIGEEASKYIEALSSNKDAATLQSHLLAMWKYYADLGKE